MLREIVDQVFLESGAVASNGHRQRHDNFGARIRGSGQAIAAVYRREFKRKPRLSRFDAVIVLGRERQPHLTQGGHFRRAQNNDLGCRVRTHGHIPRASVRAIDAQGPILYHRKIECHLRDFQLFIDSPA